MMEGERMERMKELDRYQKGILLLLAAMIVVFGVVYSVVSSQVGFLYMDKILQPSEEEGNTVYSGTIKGQESSFIVTPEREVTFHYGDKVYGPYTAKEDPTAIPEDDGFSAYMTGVEVRNGGELIFRGGIFQMGGTDSYWMLINEDGTNASFTITATMSDGTVVDGDGNAVDQMEPSVSTILELMDGPELTRKGQWLAWFGGIFISIATAVSILFADELFRWNLAFQIRNVDHAEPSDWEIAGRYIGWTALTIMAFAIYIMGLQ